MFDPDKAIKYCKEDELNRSNFAKSLGDAIYNYKIEDCLVIGLLGKWGYGKTSIINMAVEHIKECSNADEKPPIILEFNPWIFSNQNQLLKKFFDELGLKVQDICTKEQLKTYINKLIPPVMGIASIFAPNQVQALSDIARYLDEHKSDEESLETIKSQLNDCINENNQKIIVIIDDIDRLNDFEIQQIFQLTKTIADFSNTIYLLSFDRDVVIKSLEGIQTSSGYQYLDKIIPIQFNVPKIHKNEIENILFSQIDKIIHFEDEADQLYWWNLYHSGLKYFFNSIRDVKRYINTANFYFGLIHDEVCHADFLAIIAIELFAPKVYNGLLNNKELFAGIFKNTDDYDSMKERAKNQCDDIIENEDPQLQQPLKELLIYMFPRLEAFYKNNYYGTEWLPTWRKKLRICSPDRFEIYFKLSIPEDKISQNEIKHILSLTNNPDLFSKELLKLNDNQKILQFLEIFEDYIKDIHENDIENVITVLIDIGDLFPNIKINLFDIGTDMKVLRIIHQLSWRFGTYDERFDILKKAMEKSTNSLYTVVHKVGIEDQRQGRYNLAENPKPEGKWTVNSDQLDALEEIALNKIREWAYDGRLAKHDDLIEILYNWKRWESKKAIEYINNMINTEKGLVNFITHFLYQSSSLKISDRVPKLSWNINLDNISELVELGLIESRLRNISKNIPLNDQNKLAIKLFLKKIENNSDS